MCVCVCVRVCVCVCVCVCVRAGGRVCTSEGADEYDSVYVGGFGSIYENKL